MVRVAAGVNNPTLLVASYDYMFIASSSCQGGIKEAIAAGITKGSNTNTEATIA
ncbi:hypothetical protein ACFLWS_01730 [Chloroflexota bacterium]